MKKIGLVGGLGPASTVEYYLGLSRLYRESFGDSVYPKILIDSVDMRIHNDAFDKKDYSAIAGYLLESLTCLKNAGAEVAGITANTEHIVWNLIRDKLPLPTLSIIDTAVDAIRRSGYQCVVVFATHWTLDSGLYERALNEAGITPVVPDEADRALLGRLIYPNLENGIIIPEDKERMIALAEKYIKKAGANALLMGCTEIPLMLQPGDLEVPLINTTELHIKALYEESLK